MFWTLDSFNTKFSANSVGWCPIKNYKDTFVCRTFHLKENEVITTSEPNKRFGGIYLFQAKYGKLNLLEEIETPAVLDIKWARTRVSNKILLAVAYTKGYVQIYQLLDGSTFHSNISFLKRN